jgi:hypothetical protein
MSARRLPAASSVDLLLFLAMSATALAGLGTSYT